MSEIEFKLIGEYVELNQLLKLTGICASGGAGKLRVAAGDVTVDGQVELRKTCKIRAGQVVRVDDRLIRVLAP
ncbi:MAG: RNA-binding protein [Candidatus Muproteobacteria bacterium RBG_16_62_13]|uniref:RNA-binding protein n=1 Tax=Candidatus Muproteobacteria bacterium RBG_16_62_13 TaxID=1817756 RepID=A0A1F6T753_9PROT|nr:MAG: RNA-binding protein [Candidatus Muproteobacteria bacterium RBG_16_62_13]